MEQSGEQDHYPFVGYPTLALAASSMKTWVWLLLALASPAAQAEIYACSKHGATTYQNFPCPFDSMGSMPTARAQPAIASVGTRPKPFSTCAINV